jgi:hypothetical protein
MKDKLYDFLKKCLNLFMFLVIATPVFGVTGMVAKNELLTQAAAVVMGLLCITVVLFDIESSRRSHAKARQRLQDQRDSASPDWDGTVRSVEDIEPRLSLLQARIEQDQKEVSALHEASRRIAAINRAANP